MGVGGGGTWWGSGRCWRGSRARLRNMDLALPKALPGDHRRHAQE